MTAVVMMDHVSIAKKGTKTKGMVCGLVRGSLDKKTQIGESLQVAPVNNRCGRLIPRNLLEKLLHQDKPQGKGSRRASLPEPQR